MPTTPGLIYGDGRGRRQGAGAEAEGFLGWTAAEAPDAHGYWPAQAVANHSLSGEAVLDTSAAASSMPVFSLEQWGWDAELLARHGARLDQLPASPAWARPWAGWATSPTRCSTAVASTPSASRSWPARATRVTCSCSSAPP